MQRTSTTNIDVEMQGQVAIRLLATTLRANVGEFRHIAESKVQCPRRSVQAKWLSTQLSNYNRNSHGHA